MLSESYIGSLYLLYVCMYDYVHPSSCTCTEDTNLMSPGLLLEQRSRLFQGQEPGGIVVEGSLPGWGDVIEVLPVPFLPCLCRERRRRRSLRRLMGWQGLWRGVMGSCFWGKPGMKAFKINFNSAVEAVYSQININIYGCQMYYRRLWTPYSLSVWLFKKIITTHWFGLNLCFWWTEMRSDFSRTSK